MTAPIALAAARPVRLISTGTSADACFAGASADGARVFFETTEAIEAAP